MDMLLDESKVLLVTPCEWPTYRSDLGNVHAQAFEEERVRVIRGDDLVDGAR